MKIWVDFPVSGIYNKQKSIEKVDKAVGVNAKKDVISISAQAKGYQTVLRALKDIPDIRQEKVNEIFGRLQAGTYDISGKDVADKIINSTIDKTV